MVMENISYTQAPLESLHHPENRFLPHKYPRDLLQPYRAHSLMAPPGCLQAKKIVIPHLSHGHYFRSFQRKKNGPGRFLFKLNL